MYTPQDNGLMKCIVIWGTQEQLPQINKRDFGVWETLTYRWTHPKWEHEEPIDPFQESKNNLL